MKYRLMLTTLSAKIRGHSARLSRIIIIVLLFNTLITKHSFLAELEMIFILPFFSPTHKIMYFTGYMYLLTMDDVYAVHHDHYLGSVTMC